MISRPQTLGNLQIMTGHQMMSLTLQILTNFKTSWMVNLMHQRKIRYTSEVFHVFFAYDFGGKHPDSAGRNSRKNMVARDARMERDLASQKSNFGHEANARSGMKEFVRRNLH